MGFETNSEESYNEHMKYMFNELYEDIKHGDEDHQKWLKDKINEFLTKRGIV